MRCEKCGEREAVVHWTEVEHRKSAEKHYCEVCYVKLRPADVPTGVALTGPDGKPAESTTLERLTVRTLKGTCEPRVKKDKPHEV